MDCFIGRIQGGLGNQLFIYSFLRAISLIHKTPFKLDLTTTKWTPSRKYGLCNFTIVENVASIKEIDYLKEDIINEKHFYFSEEYLNYKKGYFQGYFQSEKYFRPFSDIIKSDIKLKDTICSYEPEVINQLKQDEHSVLLGVRRGDYINNNLINFHGIIGNDYYNNAINLISDKIGKINLYIMSDDVQWVKDNMKFDYPVTYLSKPYDVFHDGNAINNYDYEDLIVGSYSKNFIIPNSTFFWWMAWLSESNDKNVVAPNQWFINEKMFKQSYDIIPDGWYRI